MKQHIINHCIAYSLAGFMLITLTLMILIPDVVIIGSTPINGIIFSTWLPTVIFMVIISIIITKQKD